MSACSLGTNWLRVVRHVPVVEQEYGRVAGQRVIRDELVYLWYRKNVPEPGVSAGVVEDEGRTSQSR